MRKKDKLYTVNKWNKALFAPDDTVFPIGNKFLGGGGMGSLAATNPSTFFGTGTGTPTFGTSTTAPLSGLSSLSQNTNPFGVSTQLTAPSAPQIDWSSGSQRGAAMGQVQNMVNNIGNPNALSTSESNQLLSQSVNGDLINKSVLSTSLNSKSIGTALKGAAGAIGSVVGSIGQNLISGGYSSGAGNAIGSIGGTIGGAVSSFNPLLGGIVSAGSGIIGGITNALFGEKVDEAKLAQAKSDIAALSSIDGDVDSFDEITGPVAVASVDGTYKGGLFNKSARRKQKDLEEQMARAKSWADRSVGNNIYNLASDQFANALRNISAFGGSLDMMVNNNGMGAIEYGLMSDYLAEKKRQNEAKNKTAGMVATPAFMGNGYGYGGCLPNMFCGGGRRMFGIGGDMQTNSSDFSTGLTHIDEGGQHETNPYEGVQVGVDSEGTPNLVEENETIFDDYVYSARIEADEQTLEKFHLPKKSKLTYAEISKKLEKEAAERPNDPISRAGLSAMMHKLADEQERQKQEMETQRAKEAFEALSDEEKVAVIQQQTQQKQAQEQQLAEQQAMQEQAMAEQAAMEGQGVPSPEEQAMIEQQAAQQQGAVNADGGPINRFDKGGDMKKRIYSLLPNIHTDGDFAKWAKDNNIDTEGINWENALENSSLMEAVAKDNPALKHALGEGYDFGIYQDNPNKPLNFDDNRGNWDAQTVQGWWGSTDPAWQEVIKNHPELTEETNLTKEQLADYLRNTEAFKRGTQWLQNSEDNRLSYLQRIINNPDAPKKAREYAMKFADENGWKEDAARDYETIFNNPSGRAANPGTYWKTPIEAVRGNSSGNFVINDDGSVEAIVGDVPQGWASAGSYAWATPENDYSYNYYRRPTASPATQSVGDVTGGISTGDEWVATPNYKNDGLRYAGLLGPAVGLGMQALGIGKPDTSGLDAAASMAGRAAHRARFQPLGNYLTYRPMDIWFEQNRLNANSRATDRAIVNSGVNQGSKMAGLLANGYNDLIASGELFKKGLEYNDAQRKMVADFNRGTDQFNAEQYGATSRFNADALNRAGQLAAQMRMQAAAHKMDADAGWNSGIYGNVSELFKGIGELGRENAQHNMIAEMAADGLFGTLSPKTNTGKKGKFLTWSKKNTSSEGGKIKKKRRGLMF